MTPSETEEFNHRNINITTEAKTPSRVETPF